jgi:hypothetical protein
MSNLSLFDLKLRLRVRPHSEDPFLIGQDVIWQSCDWPNENLVFIQVKISNPNLVDPLIPLVLNQESASAFVWACCRQCHRLRERSLAASPPESL